MRQLQICDPDIVDYLQETQALFSGMYGETWVFFFFFSITFVCYSSFSADLAKTSNVFRQKIELLA